MSAIDVALEAMRTDARLWDRAADDAQSPRSALNGATLTPEDVSMWAADAGLLQTYDQAIMRVQALLQQGADNFHAIAQALRASADTYQREDEAGRHTFDSTD